MSAAMNALPANRALKFSEEQSIILDTARSFCRDRSPVAAVRSLLDNESGFAASVWQEQVEMGWPGIAIPEGYGGSGLGIGAVVPVAEQMGRSLLCTPLISTTLAAQAILRGASESQRQEWLPRITAGQIGTLALTENEDAGDETIRCRATTTDDGLALSGSKRFVCDAGAADFFVVSVTHEAQPALVIVTAEQLPGSAITAQTLIDETKRAGSIDLTGAQVPATALLQPGNIESTLRDIKLIGALLTAAEATGSCSAALDCVVEYLKTRKQFGKLIGSYQALKHPTVDMLTGMDAARSLVYHAATVTGDGALDSDAEIACRMAKAQATDALLFAGDRAVQFHGAMGFTYECDAQLYIRRAQWIQSQYGDVRHHHKRLADLLLG